MAIHRQELPLSSLHSVSDGYVTVSRCRRCGIVVGFGDRCEFCTSQRGEYVDQPGEYIGRHHTEWVTTVDELLIQGDDDDAEFLLWRLVDAAEQEALIAHVPPFERHFTRLTQLARRRGDERLATLVRERYERCVNETRSPPDAAAG